MSGYDDLVPAADPYADLAPRGAQAPTTPQTGSNALPESSGGIFDPAMRPSRPLSGHETGLLIKGGIEGGAGTVTAPADWTIAGTNWIRKHVFGYHDDELLQTNASQGTHKLLEAVGFPKAQNQEDSDLELGGNVVGALAGAALAAGGPRAAAGADARTGGVANFKPSASTSPGTPNQAILNNSWAQQIGVPGATRLTEGVLDQADRQISQVLDSVRSPAHIVMRDPAKVAGQFAELASNTSKEVLDNPTVQRVLKGFEDTKGTVNAEQLGEWSSQLGNTARTAIQHDYDLGTGLFKAKDALEGMISETLSPQEQSVYDAARQQYRALYGQLLARSGHLSKAGDVDGAAVGRFLARTDNNYNLGRYDSLAYKATAGADMQAGNRTLMDAVQRAPSHTFAALRAIAQFAPTQIQRIKQIGIPAVVDSLKNQPGFVTALGRSLSQADQDQAQQSQ